MRYSCTKYTYIYHENSYVSKLSGYHFILLIKIRFVPISHFFLLWDACVAMMGRLHRSVRYDVTSLYNLITHRQLVKNSDKITKRLMFINCAIKFKIKKYTFSTLPMLFLYVFKSKSLQI